MPRSSCVSYSVELAKEDLTFGDVVRKTFLRSPPVPNKSPPHVLCEAAELVPTFLVLGARMETNNGPGSHCLFFRSYGYM